MLPSVLTCFPCLRRHDSEESIDRDTHASHAAHNDVPPLSPFSAARVAATEQTALLQAQRAQELAQRNRLAAQAREAAREEYPVDIMIGDVLDGKLPPSHVSHDRHIWPRLQEMDQQEFDDAEDIMTVVMEEAGNTENRLRVDATMLNQIFARDRTAMPLPEFLANIVHGQLLQRAVPMCAPADELEFAQMLRAVAEKTVLFGPVGKVMLVQGCIALMASTPETAGRRLRISRVIRHFEEHCNPTRFQSNQQLAKGFAIEAAINAIMAAPPSPALSAEPSPVTSPRYSPLDSPLSLAAQPEAARYSVADELDDDEIEGLLVAQ